MTLVHQRFISYRPLRHKRTSHWRWWTETVYKT